MTHNGLLGTPTPTPTAERSELAFFATSIAALADENDAPNEILNSVVLRHGMDRERMLSDIAGRMGYSCMAELEQDLVTQIAEQLFGLQSCHLTAAERDQKRLISSL